MSQKVTEKQENSQHINIQPNTWQKRQYSQKQEQRMVEETNVKCITTIEEKTGKRLRVKKTKQLHNMTKGSKEIKSIKV